MKRIKVLQIRETPKTKCGGIDANCNAIEMAFENDKEVHVLPAVDFFKKEVNYLRTGYITSQDIQKAIKKFDPDILHVHGSYTFTILNAIKAAIKYRKRVVYSPHFHPFYSLRRPFMGMIFFQIFIRPLLKYVDTVITINNEDTNWFQKYHPNVVRIAHWSKVCLNSQENIVKKKNMILFVGRVNDSIKGIEHIYSLPEGLYDIHCVGKGNLLKRSDIIQHVDIDEEDLVKLYREASLLVVPSRYEAFSYVSVEALSCNTPIVVSDRVRIADYFKECSYVSIFRYGDMEDFSKAIKKTIGNKVDLDFVVKMFDHGRLKGLYKGIYMNQSR